MVQSRSFRHRCSQAELGDKVHDTQTVQLLKALATEDESLKTIHPALHDLCFITRHDVTWFFLFWDYKDPEATD